MQNYTPMIRQYLEIKNQYRDCILFFRLGDFYEMFFEDAETAARELEIALTARDGGGGKRVPMCGVPYHAAEGYIARLLEKGYRIAICEQMEDPAQAKGIVRREVTRVITPGTVLEASLLDEKQKNYLAGLVIGHKGIGLAAAEVSTGEFLVAALKGDTALDMAVDELVRLNPAELLLGAPDEEEARFRRRIERTGWRIPALHRRQVAGPAAAAQVVVEAFNLTSPAALDLEGEEEALAAVAAVLEFIKETRKEIPAHLNPPRRYHPGSYMLLDAATRRNLELTRTMREGKSRGSLLWVLDRTSTAMGGRMLKSWVEQPLTDVNALNERLDAVEELVRDSFLREQLTLELKRVHDLERLVGRVACGNAGPRDLLALRQSLAVLPAIKELLGGARAKGLQEVAAAIEPLPELREKLEAALHDDPPVTLKEGGIIKDGWHPEVDRLRRAARDGKQWILELEARERERTGIKSLKVGYNRVFGYYIEVTKANTALVPPDYQRKQTLANAERYITPELKEMENTILGAQERVCQLEYELFLQLREEVAARREQIQQTARALARLDALCSLARAAVENGYTRPVVSNDDAIKIYNGRHPVVEKMLPPGTFVPNDVILDNHEQRLLIITGPNMGGKSTYIRMAALIVLMAQIGSFVPADRAEIGIVDRIFTRVGAADDLATGQSTFMVEMNEVANILRNATSRSLVILDEVGRGTSTYDGLSIAWAVTEYIYDPRRIGAKTLFATHYHELTELAEMLPAVKNYRVAVQEEGEDVVFLRKIQPGGADKSYGIQVARLAGLPVEVLNRAREILKSLERQEDAGKRVRESILSFSAGGDDLAAGKQLQLFPEYVAEPHPLLEEIKKLNIATITPLEALNILNDLQQRLLAEETGKKGHGVNGGRREERGKTGAYRN
ncbi:MAG: mismatch repair protein MutS [Eubacteriales bacterium]|nr:mismatch repair protein MutS [Eubacteriales bacterium]